MEWLKKLIENAEKKEDGSVDMDGLMKHITAEFPKNAVPKSVFNDVKKQLKTANAALETLKKNNTEIEALQVTITAYEKTIRKLQEDAAYTARTYELKEQLRKLAVLDPDYLIYKLGGLEKFSFDQVGKPIGSEEERVSKSYDK